MMVPMEPMPCDVPIEDVLDDLVPEWREGKLSPEEVVALCMERAAKELDTLMDIYNALGGLS